jgi:hypothetical protein
MERGCIYYCFVHKKNIGIDSEKISFMGSASGCVQKIAKMDGPLFFMES